MLYQALTDDDHQKLLAAGQLSMVGALIFLWTGAFLHFRGAAPALLLNLGSQTFWTGFCVGLGITLGLFSIVMNIRGMVALRRSRNRGD